MLPLTYILAKSYGIIGPAIGSLVSISVYNFIRIILLWKKFKLYPFTFHTLKTILLAGMFVRSLFFILSYATGTVYMKLTPDIYPVIQTIKKRLGIRSR
jgi:hypothetical protein